MAGEALNEDEIMHSAVIRVITLGILSLTLVLSQAGVSVAENTVPVEKDFLKQPGEIALVWNPFVGLFEKIFPPTSGPAAIWIQLRNEKATAVAFRPAKIVAISGPDGALQSDGVDIDTSSCAAELAPGAACAIKLTAKPLWPGAYDVTVGVGGEHGGWSERDISVKWRLSIVVAFFVAMAGLAAGVWIDSWRTRGRHAADAAIRLRDVLASLDDSPLHPPLRDAISALKRDAGAKVAAFESAGVDQAEMLSLIARCERLRQAGTIIRAFSQLDSEGQAALDPRLAPLLRILLSATPKPDEVDRLDALREGIVKNIADWPLASRVLRQGAVLARSLGDHATQFAALPNFAQAMGDGSVRIENALVQLRELQAADAAAQPPTVETAAAVAKESFRQTAVAVIRATDELVEWLEPSDGEDVAIANHRADLRRRLASIRNEQLADPPAALRGLWSIAKNALQLRNKENVSGQEETVAEYPAVTQDAASYVKPIQVDFGISLSRSVDDLRSLRSRNDRIVNVAMLTLGSVTLATATATSSTWGTGTDIVTLFLLGVGVRVAVEAVRQ